jgi:hypothetical protein
MRSRRGVGAWLAAGAVALVLGGVIGGCAGDGGNPAGSPEFVAEASDFECLKNWPKVRNVRLTNRLGHLDEALALAEGAAPGAQYPVGTIIQLFPGEAMVKRGGGYDPENNDWEYFELEVTAAGTAIAKRGRDDVINMLGGQCFGCHAAARDHDFICERGRGCIDLPVTGEQIAVLQDLDPRCR